MSALPTLPGFSNPVRDAQSVFRAALTAFSRPGIPVPLPVCPPPLPISGFSQGMLALALALADGNTPLWLDSAADTSELRHHLRFNCAVSFAASPADASFAFISQVESMPRLHGFNPGQPKSPDRSATLVISTSISVASTVTMELTGPGVKGNERGVWQPFRISGLPQWFWEDWEENFAAYPLGVDVLFVDTWTESSSNSVVRLLGLPRIAQVRSPLHVQTDSLPPKEYSACM